MPHPAVTQILSNSTAIVTDFPLHFGTAHAPYQMLTHPGARSLPPKGKKRWETAPDPPVSG